MQLKRYIFGLMAMLALLMGVQEPLFAADAKRKHHSSSSSDHHKADKCCEKSKKLLKQINQTTMQDLVVDQTTLNVVNQINQTTRTDLAVDQEILADVEQLLDCSCTCTVILPQDFMDSNGVLSQTYTITTPGSYCLGADVAFFPLNEFTPAINILSNDVRLDLRGFTLSQDSASGTSDAYGVLIGEGIHPDDPDAVFKNISVTNGTIRDFQGVGVFCYNASFDGPTTELPFQSLAFTDLSVLECGIADSPNYFGSGINLDSQAADDTFDSPSPVAFKNIIIKNCNVNRCFGNGAITIWIGNDIVIEDTQANDLSADIENEQHSDLTGTYAYKLVSTNLQMSNCQGNNASSQDPNFGLVGGAAIENCVNVYVKDCQFNGAFGEASSLVANNFTLTQNAVFENCQFNNNQGGDSTVQVAGVHMSVSFGEIINTGGIKFINCQANGASISPNNPGGNPFDNTLFGFFGFSVKNMIFENCQACNINTTSPGFNAIGFFLATIPFADVPPAGPAHNITFSNCTASDISAGDGNAYGIRLDNINFQLTPQQGGVANNTVIENCIVERISSATPDALGVAGIAQNFDASQFGTQFDLMKNLFIRGCRVSDVRSNVGGPPIALSAGILVESVLNPVIIGNSVSDCDRGILFTGTDDIIPNGFQLAASFADATAFPPVFIALNTIPSSTPAQNFNNLTQSNSVSIAPSTSTIDTVFDFIFPSADLTALGWQPGDKIHYDCNGGSPISNLVCNTDYYAIVYTPGFSENGLIQNNEVDNCSISCYQDDLSTTSSAWVNNTAFNCGASPTQFTNYDITFAGVRPVDAGTLIAYPVGGNKYYNLSLVP